MTPVSKRRSPVAGRWPAVGGLWSVVCGRGVGLLLALSASAHAQQDTLSRALIKRSEAFTLLGFAAASAAISPADEPLASQFRRPGVQRPSLDHAAGVLNFVGDPGTVLGSLGLFAFGAVTNRRSAADAGLHAGESVVVASVITGALKNLFGRARPYVSADTNAYDFEFGRGKDGGQYQSLPSGHTTAAFAFAAALASEASVWKPGWRWVAQSGYATATLVALARMYDDKHWASDVVLGAGIGIVAAKATVRFNHARPNNRVDRALIGGDERGSFRLSAWRGADGRTRVGLARAW